MSRPTCVLYANPSHRLYNHACSVVEGTFKMMANIHKDYVIVDDVVVEMKPDVVISFLSDRILRGKILELPNINFHPAPPKYPGRGGASYAIFNGDKTYGATAHRMTDKIDAGEIYLLDYFRINPSWGCKELFEAAEDVCLEQLREFCKIYLQDRKLPFTHAIAWDGKAKTRKDFQEFLNFGEIFIDDDVYGSEEARLTRLIKACRHPDFPGPYITIAGYKFELSKNQ